MGCCSSIGRIIIVFLNLIIFLVGLALTVVGALILAGGDTVRTWLQPLVVQLDRVLRQIGADVDIKDLDIKQFVGGLEIIILIIGIVLLLIAVFGIIGACCKVKCMLIVYAIAVAIVLCAQIVILIIIFAARNVFDSNVKNALNKTIAEKYAGDNATDATSTTWNVLMLNLKCCGVDNSDDFYSASQWPRSYDGRKLQTPIVCCKKFPANATDLQCATNPTNATSSYRQGCYNKLWTFIDDNKASVIGITVAIIVLQLLLIIFTIVIIREEKSKDYPD